MYYRQALGIIEARRQNARFTADEHLREIEQKFPDIARRKRELADTSIALTRIILEKPADAQKLLHQLKEHNLQLQAEIRSMLRQKGFPEDYLSIRYTCPVCSDTGYVHSRKCECLQQLVRDLATQALNEMSPLTLSEFSSFRLDYYPDTPIDDSGVIPRSQMEKIFLYCRAYADHFRPNAQSLFMIGNTGLGKTHLSLAIAKQVIAQGYTVLYGSVQDFLRDINAEQFGRVADRDTLGLLLDADLLILDDLGAEFDSNFNSATIYNIINTRANQNRPMIINTNLRVGELEAKYSARIVSRLFVFDVLRFRGKDIRQLKGRL